MDYDLDFHFRADRIKHDRYEHNYDQTTEFSLMFSRRYRSVSSKWDSAVLQGNVAVVSLWMANDVINIHEEIDLSQLEGE